MWEVGPMMRKVCYITGTRADFGLMASTLKAIHADDALELDLLVTGMHLSADHGHTVDEIEAAGLTIRARLPVALRPTTGATMARGIGHILLACVDSLQDDPPDLVLLLGDRGEMLAGAIAALHLNLPIVHIHGGERSGTVDEPVRHAISKLAHYHCVASAQSRARLIRLGEWKESVFVTGAPGLDGLTGLVQETRADLCRVLALDAQRPIALMVFHPVLQEADDAAQATTTILDALRAHGCQVVALMPNADAGSDAIRQVLQSAAADADIRVQPHLKRPRFASLMAACDCMIGNSSAGIIEAATFGTPVINLGSRQNLRERNANVVDVPLQTGPIRQAIVTALATPRREPVNVYGDGAAGARILSVLKNVSLDTAVRGKTNAY
jgi:GDP/UDP-N,N'-diacetylbacillosamine 2-epimerase (hydrolysing)